VAIDKKDTRTMGFLTVLDVDATTKEWVMPTSFPDLSGYREVAIDLETHDPNLTTLGPGWARKDGKVVGVSVAAGEEAWYFPFGHKNGPNLDRKVVLRWLQKQVATPLQRKVMHNAQYDLGWLWAEGVEVQGTVIDTMVVAALVDENRMSYSLDNLAKEYCGMRKDEKLLRAAAKDWAVDPKKDMWMLPAIYVGAYAEQDARATLALWKALQKELDAQQLQAIFEIEQPLTEVLVKMRQRGVRVDLDKAEQSRKFLRSRVSELKAFIKDKSGVDIEPWAAASVQKVFDNLNLTYDKTETGQPSFTKMFLNAHPHEVAKAVVQLREMDKADSTFIDSILNHSVDGRIHCEYHQLRSDDGGTITGRMACSSPNLQQLPARDPEVKKLIRGIFIPEDGCRWGSFDYSSQEPRLLVHFASILPDSMRHPVVDQFVEGYGQGDFDFHQMVADLTGLKRKEAKTCIAEGQEVLTDKGLIPIEKITVDHLVWDGVEWVSHEGVVYMGEKEVITYDGLTATADHEVWVGRERTLPFGVAASRLERLARTGTGKRPVRLLDDCLKGHRAARKAYLRESALRLWDRGLESSRQLASWAFHSVSVLQHQGAASEGWEYAGGNPCGTTSSAEGGVCFPALQQPQRQGLPKLWWPWNSLSFFFQKRTFGPPAFSALCGGLDGLRGGPYRQQWALRAGEPETGYAGLEQAKPQAHCLGGVSWAKGCASAPLAPDQNRSPRLFFWPCEGANPAGAGDKAGEHSELHPARKARVYDIRNAGPHHRFTVSGRLVHNCGLGVVYGMGKNKLAQQLSVSLEEANSILSRLDQKVPFVRSLAEIASRQAENHGKVRTVAGRLCRFPMWESRSFGYTKPLPHDEAMKEYGPGIRRAFTYKALNKLIQGSAADQTKKAMVDCMGQGLLPMLQVHDELCFNVESDAQAAQIAEIMENGIRLMVPSKVDQDLQTNWGDVD
jgi:DNA polymerase I-like protein with 3'-5' exonuclease and polymerase domains